jgi:hypothetical protein
MSLTHRIRPTSRDGDAKDTRERLRLGGAPPAWWDADIKSRQPDWPLSDGRLSEGRPSSAAVMYSCPGPGSGPIPWRSGYVPRPWVPGRSPGNGTAAPRRVVSGERGPPPAPAHEPEPGEGTGRMGQGRAYGANLEGVAVLGDRGGAKFSLTSLRPSLCGLSCGTARGRGAR